MEELAAYCLRRATRAEEALALALEVVGAGEEAAGWAMVRTGRADAESMRRLVDQLRALPALEAGAPLVAAPAAAGNVKHRRSQPGPADDRGMWERVDVPAVGGPVDGRNLLVPIDDEGVPPATIDQSWLWVEYGGELLDADVDGVYELEPVAGAGPPWVYVWVPTAR